MYVEKCSLSCWIDAGESKVCYSVIMKKFKLQYRTRRVVIVILAVAGLIGAVIVNPASYEPSQETQASVNGSTQSAELGDTFVDVGVEGEVENESLATTVLGKLEVKGRAPKTGYKREEFYKTWPKIDGCSLRQIIIRREVGETAKMAGNNCTVLAGEFDEPYTGEHLAFAEKTEFSKGIQIDHVVALSDAWQKGAQYKTSEERYAMATDPLNLLAVDASANQGKSDGDAATWLPPNKGFRCQYVARQISVKYKYGLWVTEAEHNAMAEILATCPHEPVVGVEL